MDASDIKRTFDIPQYCAKKFGDTPIFYDRKNGKWQAVTCEKYRDNSALLALGLLTIGINKGDAIATIFGGNTAQWNIIDMALAQIGAIHIPVYPTSSDSDYLYILQQANVKLIFVGDQAVYNKVSVLQSELPKLEHIYAVEKLPNVSNIKYLVSLGEQSEQETIGTLEKLKNDITSEDIVTIIYTSGTTGLPKGVLLSHKNILCSMNAAAAIQPLGKASRILSFLPLCHVYERTANYQFQIKGAEIFYCDNMKALMASFREVKPDGTTVVPRVLEKTIKLVQVKAGKKNFLVKWFILWAIGLGLRFRPYVKRGGFYRLRLNIAYYTVFRQVRTTFGGKICYIGCGGAPINDKVQRFFWACKMPIYEGYGLTEAAPLVALNYPGKGNYWIGSVGPVVENVQVKIADDGEVLVKGANVMVGYYNQESLTNQSIIDGWLHTGDIGAMVNNRFLKITGRKKQMFKTSYGKYIVPQAIEGRFANSPIIEHLVVIGEGKHCAGAIINPNFDYIRKMVGKFGAKPANKLIELPVVKKAIQKEIDKVNKDLGKTERIKKHLIVSDKWSAETGELSPTFKIKRNIIVQKYKRKIHQLYKGESV